MTQQQKIFFPNLDGIRFFCFLSVFFFHSRTINSSTSGDSIFNDVFNTSFSNGNLGVNFFFVLSGYLITYLLINEKQRFGKIDIISFWIRRILRIWPLYFLCVALGFFIVPYFIGMVGGKSYTETASLTAYLTFTSNFDYINKGFPGSSILGVLWSIAVEEQFYLVWPIILSIIPVKKYPFLFITIIAGSVIFRFFNREHLAQEVHTLSCIGDMAVGALGAYFCMQPAWRSKLEKMSRPVIAGIYIAAVALFLFRRQFFPEGASLQVFDRLVIAIVFLIVILEQNYAVKSIFKFSSFTTISKWGIITYGLYCFHPLTITMITTIMARMSWVNTNPVYFALQLVSSLVLTIIVATISYRLLEKPLLRLKLKYSYIVKQTPAETVPVQ